LELSKVQGVLEALDPAVAVLEEDVRQLREDRASAMGMLKVIAVLQVLIVGLLVSLFSWGLNHMTFHSDYERPERTQNVPQVSDGR